MATAFVLDQEGNVNGAVSFAGFPGLWAPDEPIEAQAFVDAGYFESVAEMQARVKELDVPLWEIDVDAGSAPIPARPDHAPNQEEATAARETVASGPPRTHAEADQLGSELGIEFPEDAKLADKVEMIDQALGGDD